MNEDIVNLIISLKLNKMLEQENMFLFCNLSIAEYRGIMAQQDGVEMTCQEMAKVMELSPSRSSRVIENLVQKGYFVRRISQYDRRSVAVTLSNRGKEVKEKIKRNSELFEQDLQKNFSEDEMNMIRDALKKLLDYFI
ncbi:MAG: MarR family transcriptional regulator [Candidatus Atribacteria bacterium]|nr:MarR family transcriptional regulator [Candidatus Atribacteria bacterium]